MGLESISGCTVLYAESWLSDYDESLTDSHALCMIHKSRDRPAEA